MGIGVLAETFGVRFVGTQGPMIVWRKHDTFDNLAFVPVVARVTFREYGAVERFVDYQVHAHPASLPRLRQRIATHPRYRQQANAASRALRIRLAHGGQCEFPPSNRPITKAARTDYTAHSFHERGSAELGYCFSAEVLFAYSLLCPSEMQ